MLSSRPHSHAASDDASRMTFAFTFPGQGSQTVGMGQSLAQNFPVARHVFEEVDEALGEHFSPPRGTRGSHADAHR